MCRWLVLMAILLGLVSPISADDWSSNTMTMLVGPLWVESGVDGSHDVTLLSFRATKSSFGYVKEARLLTEDARRCVAMTRPTADQLLVFRANEKVLLSIPHTTYRTKIWLSLAVTPKTSLNHSFGAVLESVNYQSILLPQPTSKTSNVDGTKGGLDWIVSMMIIVLSILGFSAVIALFGSCTYPGRSYGSAASTDGWGMYSPPQVGDGKFPVYRETPHGSWAMGPEHVVIDGKKWEITNHDLQSGATYVKSMEWGDGTEARIARDGKVEMGWPWGYM